MKKTAVLAAIAAASCLLPAIVRAQPAPAGGAPGSVAVVAGAPAPHVNDFDQFGMTPLHWAAMEGLPQNIALLLAHGADPNLRDATGMTPLHYAAQTGRQDVMALLLQRGARPEIKDEDGMTALAWASLGGYTDSMDLLLNR